MTIVETFMAMIRRHPTYRNAVHTQSVLTITSNLVYGKKTGNTHDGRRAGAPFAPRANPMNGRDTHGMLASALSVAKLPDSEAQDGISLTNTVVSIGLGHTPAERITNLVGLIDAYTLASGYHLNINVLNRETLEDAMAHPENYPQLTIRLSAALPVLPQPGYLEDEGRRVDADRRRAGAHPSLPGCVRGDRLRERGTNVWVRFVLVPGLTDALDNVDAVAEIVARWPNVSRVEVLPFHQMGKDKWNRLAIPYPLHGVHPPDAVLLERVRDQFRARGLTVF